jgi:predicted amidohydrolase
MGVITAEFDAALQAETRARFPALENRRLELPSDEAVSA